MDVSKLHERAEDAIKRKNYEYAIDLLKNQVLTIYPNDVKARKLLRGCENRKFGENGYPTAMQARMKGLTPLVKITILKLLKKWEKVMEECENYLINDPRNKKVLSTLGLAAANAGHLDTAISQYEACLEIDSNHCPSLRALGYLFEQQDELVKASEFFKKASFVDQTDGESKRKLKDLSARITATDYGKAKSSRELIKEREVADSLEKEEKILRSKEDYLDAIERSKRELEANPDEGKRHNRRLGELHQGIQEFVKAIEFFEAALKLDPTSFDLTVRIGDCKIAEMEDKVKTLKKKAQGGDADAQQKLKASQKKLQEYQIEEYERRVKEHPTDLDKRYQLGRVLFVAGRVDDAISHLQQSTKHPQRKVDSYNYLGQAFMKQGEHDLAIKQFGKAVEEVSKNDDRWKQIHYSLGQAYEALGQKDKALKEFTDIMEVDINFKDAKDRVKKLRV